MEKLVLDCVRSGLSEDATTEILQSLPKKVRSNAAFDWSFMGRPDQQLPEGDWNTWAICAGRAWGKTRTGANATKAATLTTERIALVGATAADVRDVMIEGESGILAQFPKSERPVYVKSSRCVRFHNGAMAFCYSAEQPNRLRGPQHGFAWCDEPSAWKAPDKVMAMLRLGLRLGRKPRLVLTFTPKMIGLVKKLFEDAREATKKVFLTRGKTLDNFLSLTKEWFDEMFSAYGGTRLGRQELDGELLEEVEALFRETWILHGAAPATYRGKFKRILVSADPAGSKRRSSDEYGIIVVARGFDDRGYVLADLSGKMTPGEGGRKIFRAFDEYQADQVVGETNYGADTTESILELVAEADKRKKLPFKGVRSTENKEFRADPIAAMYEQRKITHLGEFRELEAQMTSWNPQDKTVSPGRLDATVWGFRELFFDKLTPVTPWAGRAKPLLRRV